jgi:hypothetical protein
MRDKFKICPDTSFFSEKPEASTLYPKVPLYSREVIRGKDKNVGRNFAPFPFKIDLVR